MSIKTYLMLRSARRARLEARTTSLHYSRIGQFADSLLRRESAEGASGCIN